jgi:hypothetical protein
MLHGGIPILQIEMAVNPGKLADNLKLVLNTHSAPEVPTIETILNGHAIFAIGHSGLQNLWSDQEENRFQLSKHTQCGTGKTPSGGTKAARSCKKIDGK